VNWLDCRRISGGNDAATVGQFGLAAKTGFDLLVLVAWKQRQNSKRPACRNFVQIDLLDAIFLVFHDPLADGKRHRQGRTDPAIRPWFKAFTNLAAHARRRRSQRL